MGEDAGQNERYALAAKAFGPALARLARGYKADADDRHDLLQDIHLALWRSFLSFDDRCSLRTWVYRVAHNVGASHINKRRSQRVPLVTLDEMEVAAVETSVEAAVGESQTLRRLMALIHALRPPDRQIMLLYLDDLEAVAIAEVTGLSAGAVATRIHRAKSVLTRHFQKAQGDE